LATTSTVVEFVRLFAKVLEPLAQQRHVILTPDTAPRAPWRESPSMLPSKHFLALCAIAHDRVAAAIGRLHLGAAQAVRQEGRPFPAALLPHWTSVHRTEHGHAVFCHSWCPE
jgi:hypothetical protein